MDNRIFEICRDMRDIYCEGCEVYDDCRKMRNYNCVTKNIMNRIISLEPGEGEIENEGCFICNSGKEIFFDDGRGGFRVAEYCPNCGKKI